MEYQQIIAATERQFADDERDIEARQAEVDKVQALLDRRRKALRRKRGGFTRMVESWKAIDAEVASGKPSRLDAAAEDPDERREPAGTEAAA